jgi:fermentation-respiration switch protein FrsA (DUF1100 family)
VTKLVLSFAVLYAALCAWVFATQRRMQYFPDTSRPSLVGQLAAKGVREVELVTDDGLALAAWHWPARSGRGVPEDLTLIVFHGNGGNRGWHAGWLDALADTGAGVLAVDYRGYGGNRGSPSEDGLYRDGDAAVRWAREHLGGRLVLLGQSLGGGVAVEMAARHRPAGLILENSAATLVDIARGAYPWLPVGLLMLDRFEAERRMPDVECPLLMIHGEEDRLVPIALGWRLFEAARGPRTWWAIPGGGHGEIPGELVSEYLERLATFLRGLGSPGEPALAPQETPPLPQRPDGAPALEPSGPR